MSRRRSVLGDQALHLIHDVMVPAMDELDRQALRAKVEAASIRPTPGTSDLLGTILEVRTSAGIDNRGKLRAVDTHDLLKLAPIHLVAAKTTNRKGE